MQDISYLVLCTYNVITLDYVKLTPGLSG